MNELKGDRRGLLGIGISIFISFLMTLLMFHLLPYEFHYDDLNYYALIKHFSENNFLLENEWLKIRTYLYPYLLSFFFTENIPQFLNIIMLFQWSIYVISALIFCCLTYKQHKLRYWSFAVLILNPLILVYACYVLTDLLYLSCILIALGCLFKAILIYQNGMIKFSKRFIVYISLACLFVGMAIAIRPAAVFMIPVLFVVHVFFIYKLFSSAKVTTCIMVVSSTLCFMLPLAPQITLNVILFNQFTFLPTLELGLSQLIWGLKYLKYGTNISDIGSPRMYYPNPFADLWHGNVSPIKWYMQHPITALKIFFMKLIGAFHFDYLHPYVKNLSSSLYPITTSISILILILGGVGVFVKRNMLEIKLIVLPVMFFWCVVTLPSAIELRFTLPMIAILSVYVIVGLRYIYELPSCRTKTICLIMIIILYFGFQSVGHYIFMLNSNFKLIETGLRPIQLNGDILKNSEGTNWQRNRDVCEIKDNKYIVQGWFTFKEQKNISNNTVSLFIENKGEFFLLKTIQVSIVDVTRYMNNLLHNYNLSGFRASLSKNTNIGGFNVYLFV